MEQNNFQQQRFLNQPTNYERILNVRLRKQLQFLSASKLKYSVSNVNQNNENLEKNNNSKSLLESKRGFSKNKIKGTQSDSALIKRYLKHQEETEISYCITFSNLSHLSGALTLLIPKNYPFQEPLYLYQKSIAIKDVKEIDEQQNDSGEEANDFNLKANKISQILIWVPKYKIMELVELIAIKLNQKHQQQTIIKKHIIGKIVNYFNTPTLIFLVAFLLRILVGLGSYSGKQDWPNLGDFEAHRNWMSITVNRPINQWYLQPNQNIWWRIDYPPIAAYLSYLFGSLYKFIEPQAMILQRGYQSMELTTFMRFTVLLVESVFLFPAIYLIVQHYLSSQKFTISNKYFYLTLFAFLIKPDIILIDHGHFQYNSLILGLILGAFYCLLTKNYYACCILFTMAIHSKQMAVYYAFAFFGGLIGSIRRDFQGNNTKIIVQIIKYGIIVIATSVLIWLPFILTGSAHNVIQAIFPIHRGLYQLKVQNFWCISDVIFKWQKCFTNTQLMFICFSVSTLLSLPSLFTMIFTPTKKILTIGFYTIAMTFFMFSYHVHEKSILLPLLMAPLLVKYLGVDFVTYLILAGTLGMYHLLKEDVQSLQYLVLTLFYIFFMHSFSRITSKIKILLFESENKQTKSEEIHCRLFSKYDSTFLGKVMDYFIYLILVILHLSEILVRPPQKFEYLYHLMFAFFSFCFNLYSLLICNGILLQNLKDKIWVRKDQLKSY